ncbi:MAG TPA: hypothetical protein VIK85_01995 [Coriobacteriia bacterium]
MPSRSLVLLSYGGRDDQVAETKYAILSAYRWARPSDGIEIVLYTDNPSRFDDMPVRLRPIAAEELEGWTGPEGYQYRRKLEVLRDALIQTGRPVVFVDSDTWFRRSPARLFDRIGRGRSIMHVREGNLRGRPFPQYCHDFVDCVESRTWKTSSGSPLDITSDVVWNSGVIGLDPLDNVLVDDALALIDQVYCKCELWFLEQFAIAFFLMRSTDVRGASDIVFHYWPKDLREAFHPALLRELDRTADLAPKERADELHRFRPRLHGVGQLKYVIKQAYRLTGKVWRSSLPGSAT